MVFLNLLDNEYMNSTRIILNSLGYIDSEFYFEDKTKNHLYFGGIPQNISEFYKSAYTNLKMEVLFDNDTIYEINFEKPKISFSPKSKYIISFTQPIFNLLKKLILKIYDEILCNKA